MRFRRPPVTIEGVPITLESRGARGEADRGEIVFKLDDKGPKRSFEIRLLESADRATLAHETFHFMGEVLGDLASAKDAPESLRQDYSTLIKWMGYGSHEERRALTRERFELGKKERLTADEEKRLRELTAKEERATYGWEKFLSEGKAPDARLVGAFTRFAGWMRRIYSTLTDPDGIDRHFRDAFAPRKNKRPKRQCRRVWRRSRGASRGGGAEP